MKKLMTRTEFANLAGVSAGGVTRACKKALAPAVDGKFIDANHESAKEFLEKCARPKTPSGDETPPGIDELYYKALEACQRTGKWSVNFIRQEFHMGYSRAHRILSQLEAAGAKELPKQTRADIVINLPKPNGTKAVKEKRISADTEELEEIEIPENLAAYADMTIKEVCYKFGTAPRFVDYLKAMKEIGLIAEREIKLAEIKGMLVSRQLVQEQVIEKFDEAHMKLLRDGSKTISVQVTAMVNAGEPIEEIEKFIAEKITDFIRPAKSKITKALRHDRDE